MPVVPVMFLAFEPFESAMKTARFAPSRLMKMIFDPSGLKDGLETEPLTRSEPAEPPWAFNGHDARPTLVPLPSPLYCAGMKRRELPSGLHLISVVHWRMSGDMRIGVAASVPDLVGSSIKMP